MCPLLENLENGQILTTNILVNSIANYKCDDGFFLVDGSVTRVCQLNLKWSGKKPTCKRMLSFIFLSLTFILTFLLKFKLLKRNKISLPDERFS